MTQWHKHTEEHVKKAVHEISEGKITITGHYTDARSPINAHCNVCNTDWTPTFDNLMHGQGCPTCGRQKTIAAKTLSNEEFLSRISKIHGDKISILSPYAGLKNKVNAQCNVCGYNWDVAPASLYKNGCPGCWEQRRNGLRRLKQEEVDRKLQEVHDGKIIMLEPYTTAKDKKKFRCLDCNHEWYATPDSVMRISGCPQCASSYGEKCIRDFLNEHNIDMKEQVKFSDCRYKRLLPFDFAIGDQASPTCLIEYDGIQHFELEHQFASDINNKEKLQLIQDRDEVKNQYCLQQKIPLFRIKYAKGNREKIKKHIYSKMQKIVKKLPNAHKYSEAINYL